MSGQGVIFTQVFNIYLYLIIAEKSILIFLISINSV